LVAAATSLEISKKYFSSFICGQSFTKAVNFVKVGSVDVEIIGLKEITKIYNKNNSIT